MSNLKRIDFQSIGAILLKKGRITHAHIDVALKFQKSNRKKRHFFGEILVKKGILDESHLMEAFLSQYSIPYIPLSKYQIDQTLLGLIPADIAHKYTLMPINRVCNSLTVSMWNPMHIDAIREVESLTKCKVLPCVELRSELEKMLDIHYRPGNGNGQK